MRAIHPLNPLTNRGSKRKYLNEVKKIAEQIDNIQIQFELAIFKAPMHLSYKEIYDVFLDEWMELVSKILKVYKLRYCFINLHFFEHQYKPLENPTT